MNRLKAVNFFFPPPPLEVSAIRHFQINTSLTSMVGRHILFFAGLSATALALVVGAIDVSERG
jgi:hypothetical protein